MGSRILAGRYELIERIGEGGMAVVFKAKDRLLNRMVAIKILKPEYIKDATFIESFRKESQLAASMVHPNIVNVYDVGKEGNIHYIVMELIDGKPLSDVIKAEAPLEPHRATDITKQIASALSTAHKHQLIHRDVKPHNILLTNEGVAKITDFGIAKAVTSNTFVGEEKEAVMGSVHYFSPEQARGAYVDERSDIYSLGIVMYEMLTGQVPFDGDTAVEVAVKHMNEEMVPPTKINPDIPQDLEDIIMKATDKIQVNRYKNADEMITALTFVKFSRRAPFPEELEAAKAETASAGAAASASDNDIDNQPLDLSGTGRKKKVKKSNSDFKLKHPQVLIAILIALILAFPAAKILAKRFETTGTTASSASSGQTSIASASSILQSSTEPVEVPNIVGLTEDEAVSILKQYGLSLTIDLELASDKYEAGQIMSQSPSSGSTVKPGYTIKANISKGEADGKTPTLAGKALSSVKQTIADYGYQVGNITEKYDDNIPANFVISQSPAAGTKIEKGASIDLVVSLGPESLELGALNLVGMSLEEATAEIEALGVTLGSISYVDNATVEENHVISQNPGVGVVLEEDQAVDLVISVGSEPEVVEPSEVYNVTIPISFEAAEEDPFELIVIVKDENSEPTTFRETHEYEEGGTEIILSGSTANAKVIISFGNKIVYQYTVNFPAGTYQ